MDAEEENSFLNALHIEVFNVHCYQKFNCVYFSLLGRISYKTLEFVHVLLICEL